ncbi:AAA family ATPase [Spongiibacter sp. KMU-158]|uniref:AAA family ATPase n=1 Tax=Spongiibacter pelagi TaxID=2760804 RepID=A0A927C636_9GAMM|nr:AAA family ATPase [Spongiibacter pelagi]MBD2860080.1 AAA family ATPase [Spongiibacter pelagi]
MIEGTTYQSFRDDYLKTYHPEAAVEAGRFNDVSIVDSTEVLKRWVDGDDEKGEERRQALKGLASKKLIFIPDHSSIKKLKDVAETNQDLSSICDEIAVYVEFCSAIGSQNFSFEPLLLLGEPGVGKTYVANELVAALGLESYKLSVSDACEAFYLSGTQRGYANSTPGRVADRMAASKHANPVLILDEIDKASFNREDGRPSLLSPLLQLLEPDSARTFRDLSLDVQIDCSRVSYICTANNLETIPKPLLSRLRVIDVRKPSKENMVKIASKILSQTYAQMTGSSMPKEYVISPCATELISAITPRDFKLQARRIVSQLAIAKPDSERYVVTKECLQFVEHQERASFIGFVDTNSVRA